MDFAKPTIEYAQLWPMLVVFGVACLGVLVEAFVPRERRYLTQAGLAVAGLAVALGGSVYVVHRPQRSSTSAGDVVARGKLAAEGTLAVDGPSVFIWGLVLVFAIGGVLLFAERRLEAGVSAFAGQAAALPGTEAEREASTRGLDHTEVYPLLMFAVGGMMLFPTANDLLTMFVALEVLSLPLYLLCGLARRRRLLSQEAALKYFLLGAFSSGFFLYGVALIYGFAGSMQFADINEAVRNDTSNSALLLIGMGMLAVGLLFKVGAVPFQAWMPDVYQGAPTAVTAFMAACTKIAAFGALLRLFYVAFGADRWDWQPMLWIIAILTMLDRLDPRGRPDRHEADARLLLGGAHRVPAHRPARRAGGLGARHGRDHLAAGGAVLPRDVRPGHGRHLRHRHAGPRRGRRGHGVLEVGGARQALAAGGRCVRVPAALDGRHPADRWVRRQVGGVRGGALGRRLAGGHRGDRGVDHLGVLLRAGDPADVLRRSGRRTPPRSPRRRC